MVLAHAEWGTAVTNTTGVELAWNSGTGRDGKHFEKHHRKSLDCCGRIVSRHMHVNSSVSEDHVLIHFTLDSNALSAMKGVQMETQALKVLPGRPQEATSGN